MVIKEKKSAKTSCFCYNKRITHHVLRYNSKPYGETDFKIKKSKYKELRLNLIIYLKYNSH